MKGLPFFPCKVYTITSFTCENKKGGSAYVWPKEKEKEQQEEHRKSIRKGLIFWLPGGSSRLDVYYDYCVMRCLGKTKMKEKERVIPFTSIQDVIYTPPPPAAWPASSSSPRKCLR